LVGTNIPKGFFSPLLGDSERAKIQEETDFS